MIDEIREIERKLESEDITEAEMNRLEARLALLHSKALYELQRLNKEALAELRTMRGQCLKD